MSPKDKPKKLFKVASEFNVSTKTIVDALAEEGFKVAAKPNSKITSEMYEVLEDTYGDDKARSKEHIKKREGYANRRKQIHSKTNSNVSVESFLEPIEDLPLEPQEDIEEEAEEELIAGLKPQEEQLEEETQKPKAAEKQEAPEDAA